MTTNRWLRGLVGTALLLLGSGCATVPDRGAWGSEATLTPGWERVRASAVNAARDPHVWVPLAGAAVFQIGDFDEEVSDWARRETPVFGSQENARDWSDHLRSASSTAYALTVLFADSGDDPSQWWSNKARGLAVGLSARALTSGLTSGLKDAVGRERPDGSDDLSFPSGHSSAAAVNGRLASRNLRYIDVSPRTRRVLDAGLLAMTIGTGWARIEAGKHYPSDTLFGMALGNFIAVFVNDAFLGDGRRADGSARGVMFEAVPDGAMVRFYAVY